MKGEIVYVGGLTIDIDEPDPLVLCQMAGRDPNEEITRFVLEDFAMTLGHLISSGDMTVERAVVMLGVVDPGSLADALCGASHWDEIFADVALYWPWDAGTPGKRDGGKARDEPAGVPPHLCNDDQTLDGRCDTCSAYRCQCKDDDCPSHRGSERCSNRWTRTFDQRPWDSGNADDLDRVCETCAIEWRMAGIDEVMTEEQTLA
jgi:hypothetical protein